MKLGDPITLDIEITGQGNFDRVFHDGLAADSGFKTYSPETDFKANATNPLKGTKTFKQAIIPNDPELNEIPPVNFVYFDTDAADFKTLSSGPILIQIDTSNPANSPGAYTDSSRLPSSGLNIVASDGWIPVQLDLDSPIGALSPYIRKPASWALLAGTPTTLLLLSWILPLLISKTRQNQQQKITELRRRLRSIEKPLNQSQNKGDIPVFLQASAQYSREVLGTIWNVSAHAITSADARQRLDDRFPIIREILQLNESQQYAGGMIPNFDIPSKRAQLDSEWKQLVESIEQS